MKKLPLYILIGLMWCGHVFSENYKCTSVVDTRDTSEINILHTYDQNYIIFSHSIWGDKFINFGYLSDNKIFSYMSSPSEQSLMMYGFSEEKDNIRSLTFLHFMSNKIGNLKSKSIFYGKKIEDYKNFELTEDELKTEIKNFEINRDYVHNLINSTLEKVNKELIIKDEYSCEKIGGKKTFNYSNGDRYVGDWNDNKRHGQGTYTRANGDVYVGEYKEDKRNGKGTYTSVNGDTYVGEWKNSMRHGKGTYTYANGDLYVGEYSDNKKNGQGTLTFIDGVTKYIGEFKDGKSHGYGEYMYENGDTYVGDFKNDYRHGQGTYTFKNFKRKIGEWKKDKFVKGETIEGFTPSQMKRLEKTLEEVKSNKDTREIIQKVGE